LSVDGSEFVKELRMPKELNLSLLIRYGYAGGLLYLILVIFNRDSVKTYTESIGSILVLFIIFAGGTCIYAIYRHLIGEWFLFPVAHGWDWLFSKSNRQTDSGAVSTIWWLAQQGVPLGVRREAYTALRRDRVSIETKKQLDLSHSEVYVLYITFLETLALGIWLWYSRNFKKGGWVALAACIFLLAAWAADVRLHRHEFRAIVPSDDSGIEDLRLFLRQRGYLSTPKINGARKSGIDRDGPGNASTS
jgi:hypothetical protein